MSDKQWTDATAADLKAGDLFRWTPRSRAARITPNRWDDARGVCFFSQDAATDRHQGFSAVLPDVPVQILK
jgi:hypothetical protein